MLWVSYFIDSMYFFIKKTLLKTSVSKTFKYMFFLLLVILDKIIIFISLSIALITSLS